MEDRIYTSQEREKLSLEYEFYHIIPLLVEAEQSSSKRSRLCKSALSKEIKAQKTILHAYVVVSWSFLLKEMVKATKN